LTRQSIIAQSRSIFVLMDARVKPGHDELADLENFAREVLEWEVTPPSSALDQPG
jgi:hypothetical protein